MCACLLESSVACPTCEATFLISSQNCPGKPEVFWFPWTPDPEQSGISSSGKMRSTAKETLRCGYGATVEVLDMGQAQGLGQWQSCLKHCGIPGEWTGTMISWSEGNPPQNVFLYVSFHSSAPVPQDNFGNSNTFPKCYHDNFCFQ